MDYLFERHTPDPADGVFSVDATEREMQLAIDNSMTGISWLTAEGVFAEVRTGYASMLGYSPEELRGLSWDATIPEPDHEKTRAALTKMLNNGRAKAEVRALRKDGSTFHKQLLLVKTVDATGEYNGHYCFMRNITKRKQSDEALRRSHEFSDRLLEVIQDGVSVVDEHGVHIKVNNALVQMTGFAREELIGRGIPHPYWPEEHVDSIMSTFAKGFETAAQLELIFQRKNGQRFPALVSPSTTVNEIGNPIHIATVKDISGRKEAELRLVEAERLKTMGMLAGGIAHDLNNLLTPVLGYADALLNGLQEVDVAAGAIRNAAQHAQQLIARILKFSRHDTQSMASASVVKATEDALQFARTALPANVSVTTRFDAVHDTVACTDVVMQQVIMNLVSNAGYAIGEAGGTVNIDIYNPNTAAIEVVVSDTGCGIPDGQLQRIFEPFYTTKPVDEGTGLGLATVHGAVTAANGTIEVSSPLGSGAVFTIRLPLCDPAAAAKRDQAGRAGKSQAPLRVMLIDDQVEVLSVSTALLEHLGHKVTSFVDARDALRCDPQTFDLIITDNRMSGMTGVEFVAAAGELHVPVILMTGDGVAGESLPPGIRWRLSKPFNLGDLHDAIAAVVNS